MDSEHSPEDVPIRAGIFAQEEHAKEAIELLNQNGFDSHQISVVCNHPEFRERFRKYVHKSSSPEKSDNAVQNAGKFGIGLGGTVLLAELVTGGGIPVFVFGPLAAVAIVITFAGLMASRGMESEIADFYEQSVQAGDILVAVETEGDDKEAKLDLAEELFKQAGAKPVPLPKG